MRVLIAEDEPIIGGAIADQMRALGCTVLGVVRDSSEGRRLILEGRPDVLLLDVDLEDGPTGPLLAAEDVRGGADVLFLTGRDVEDFDECGSRVEIMSKPFRPRELEGWINTVRERRAA